MARFLPIPDPGGSLQPPRRPPPTALATATPDPEPNPTPWELAFALLAGREVRRTPAPGLVDEASYQVGIRRRAALLRLAEEIGAARPVPLFQDRLAALASRGARIVREILSPAWY